MSEAASVVELDGRRLRSARSQEAIVDAILDLLRETGERPAARDVAARAGVSLRTLFRHFDDVDNLLAAAAEKQIERVGAMFDVLEVDGTVAERADALARHRARLFEDIAPVRRAALRLDSHSVIRRWLGESNRRLRRQTTTLFAQELGALPSATRWLVTESLDAATGWSAWDTLRRDQRCDVTTARAVLAYTITALLEER
jgi:AcrR family transcriptional regulator